MSPTDAAAEHAYPADPCGAFVVGPALLAPGRRGGPLTGRRFAVKDLFDVEGARTGAGNPDWLADAPLAAANAASVDALLASGADLWGKTVTDELAFSLSGTNVHYGTPRNAAAPGRIPGGSSAGSAAAVAGGLVELALGTDTAGSVRVPASYCGIYSLRPTHGRVDDTGVQPLAPSFDTVGLFAADGPTLALGLAALLAGAPGPAETAVDGFSARHAPTARLVVAEDMLALADTGAREGILEGAHRLAAAAGLHLEVARLGGPGDLGAWRDAFRAIQLVEVWETHGAWITRRRPRFGPGIERRFAAAAAADPAEAKRARPLRAGVLAALADVLGGDGLLVQPAATGSAPPFDVPASAKEDLRARSFALTSPAGMAGAPVVTLPLASACDGLPVGLSVVGLPGEDEHLVELAVAASLPG